MDERVALVVLRFFLVLTSIVLAPVARAQSASHVIAGSTIEVEFPDAELPRAHLTHWIETSAEAIAAYYGVFPVKHLRITIAAVDGAEVKTGKSYGYNGAAIRLTIGKDTRFGQFRDDWVLPHEMVHLAFPSVPDTHTWLEEGLATYVEPWARLKIGELSEAKVWADFVDGMPKGLPRGGDRGLDRTHTWGRTYWGGALFCLLADIEIRRRTSNAKGLEDALRAIVRAGGNIEQQWPLERALATGDSAVGVPVLSELYEKMKHEPVSPNLPALWADLGVKVEGETISFDEDAPLAHVRRAMAARSRQLAQDALEQRVLR